MKKAYKEMRKALNRSVNIKLLLEQKQLKPQLLTEELNNYMYAYQILQ